MLDSYLIRGLYDTVMLEMSEDKNRIKDSNIQSAIQEMNALYRKETGSLKRNTVKKRPDFNKMFYRYAYLHKYAALHTVLVQDMTLRILQKHSELFRTIVTTGQFKLCCLGGGPGCDAIGVLAALTGTFGRFNINITIIDIMKNWESTFASIVEQIRYGDYGIPGNFLDPKFFKWNYIGADLLGAMTSPVNQTIANATLVTMVKFVSAAANVNTEQMVKKVFNVMKQGALVLFIDNAVGEFHELFRDVAHQSGFITIFGPLQHFKYSDKDLETYNSGYKSCCETTVTIHLLRKPFQNRQHKNQSPNCRKQPKVTSSLDNHNVTTLPQNVNLNFNSVKGYSTKLNSQLTNHQNFNNKCPTKKGNEMATEKKINHNNYQYTHFPISPSASTSPVHNVSAKKVYEGSSSNLNLQSINYQMSNNTLSTCKCHGILNQKKISINSNLCNSASASSVRSESANFMRYSSSRVQHPPAEDPDDNSWPFVSSAVVCAVSAAIAFILYRLCR